MFVSNERKNVIPKGRFAGRATAHAHIATLVLGGILAATLLGAQALVSVREGNIQARENGAKIIKEIESQGLSSYLGLEPITRYYLLEENGQLTGYAILSLQTRQNLNSSLIFQGQEVYYYPAKGLRKISSIVASNHLKNFSLQEKIEHQKKNFFMSINQQFDDGQLKMQFYNTYGMHPPRTWKINQNHFIPSPLLDVISSVATTGDRNKKGVIFALADIPLWEDRSGTILTECLVKPGGQVTPEIKAKAPGGHSVTVEWLGQERSQIIYYDSQHQLLWQESRFGSETSIIRAVSREELEKAFPQSAEDLENYLPVDTNEEKSAVL